MTQPQFLDLVPEQHPTLFPRKTSVGGTVINTSKVVRGKTVVRRPEDVLGVALHQTACVFGPRDPAKKHRRAFKIPAHVVSFMDGTYVRTAPLLWLLYHANALNPFTFGLECEGQFPGLLDDPTTPMREDVKSFWSGGGGVPTPLTPLALATHIAALEYLVDAGRRLGCPVKYLWAHRQSNESRVSDPGQELWQRLAVEHGQKVLGLELQPSRTWRDGKPIPAAWGGSGPY